MFAVQDSDLDLPSYVKAIPMKAPYLLVSSSNEETTFQVVVEQEIISELLSFQSALVMLIGTYYIFDIAYPKPLYSLLIFIQHQIFGLRDAQRNTPSVVEMVTSLKNMDDTSA